MENPDTWGRAEKTINAALDEYHKFRAAGYVGWSEPACIARRLREAGLLVDENAVDDLANHLQDMMDSLDDHVTHDDIYGQLKIAYQMAMSL